MSRIIQHHFTHNKDSAPYRPVIPIIYKKWTASTGFGGQLAPESVVDIDRFP
jgi:hypothetical protein